MATKGPGAAEKHDGSPLRIAIVHARWNTPIVEALVSGTRDALTAAGVKPANITTQSVAGSWELPYAVQKAYAGSTVQAATTGAVSATDLLGGEPATSATQAAGTATAAFDAVVAIGVLVKGESMHFEYIADAVVHGLMRVQLDAGVPVVLGLLTVLNEEQARARAGLAAGGHNHGKDWGEAAVEMGVKRRAWAEGKMI